MMSFSSENVQFLEVKFSIYLSRRVFVMNCCRNTALERSAGSRVCVCACVRECVCV